MHAISSYRGNIPTKKQTVPITIHCPAASAQCNQPKPRKWLESIQSKRISMIQRLCILGHHGAIEIVFFFLNYYSIIIGINLAFCLLPVMVLASDVLEL